MQGRDLVCTVCSLFDSHARGAGACLYILGPAIADDYMYAYADMCTRILTSLHGCAEVEDGVVLAEG